MRPVVIYTIISIAISLGLIRLVIYLEEKHPLSAVLREETQAEAGNPNPSVVSRELTLHEPPETFRYGIKFLDHLAVAFFSIGVIGLLLELPHTRRHFHEEMINLVIDHRYLNTLRDDRLKDLRVKTFKAVFKDDALDKDDSFLNFYFEKIEKNVGDPYREGTYGVTIINYSKDRKSFLVKETISYVCKKRGQRIQERVEWTTAQDELDSIEDFEILVRIPEQITNDPKFAENYPHLQPEMTFKPSVTPPATLKPNDQGHGYTLSLDNYKEMDGLFVESHVTYVVPIDRAFSWSMPSPSKGLKGRIEFPPDLMIYTDLFGIDPDALISSKDQPGLYTFEYPAWLLPDDGFAYHFRKPRADSGTVVSATVRVSETDAGAVDTAAATDGKGTVPAS